MTVLDSVRASPAGERAAHDLVSELQPQFFRARHLVRVGHGAVDALHHRLGGTFAGGEIVEAHASSLASSMTLTWAATIRQPSAKRTQVCI